MKIAVIGGGASGLTAAIAAARNGAEVTICEKLNRVGKKNSGNRQRQVQLYQYESVKGMLPL